MKIRVEFSKEDRCGIDSAEFSAEDLSSAVLKLFRLFGRGQIEVWKEFIQESLGGIGGGELSEEEDLRKCLDGVDRKDLEFLRDTIRKILLEMSNS